MKAKVVKDKRGNIYLLLPPSIHMEGEVEIFPLKEGYFLITPPLPPKAPQRKEELSPEEVALLQKVSRIPYARREMNSVLSVLDERERALLEGLLRRGVVFLRKRKGREYIAFEEALYDKLKALSKRETKGEEGRGKDVEVLDLSHGFLVIKNPKTFYKIRSYLEENRSKLRYLVDPASGYIYVATRPFLQRGAKRLMKELEKGPASAYELAERLRLPPEAVETVAKFLNEEGLLYEVEPKKKVYALVE